jgi:3-oxoacyl-[acyl-carrier-protein] synthase-1
VGLSAEGSAAAVRAGISRMREHPILVDQRGDAVVAAFDANLSPRVMGIARLREMASSAFQELVENLGAAHLPAGEREIDVLLGLPEPRPGFSAEQLTDVGRRVVEVGRALGLGLHIQTLCSGHASALEALGQAGTRLVTQPAALCIVGGADSYLHEDTIEWLIEREQLGGGAARTGFVPGEGAAFVAVANKGALTRYHLQPLAMLSGVRTSRETKLIHTDAINLGEGLAQAIAGATRSLRPPEERIDDVYGDLNGERYRTEEWGFAAMRTQHLLRSATCKTPVTEWGDVGAASGALFAVLAVQAHQHEYAKGPRALIWAGSEGGTRAAAVLQKV